MSVLAFVHGFRLWVLDICLCDGCDSGLLVLYLVVVLIIIMVLNFVMGLVLVVVLSNIIKLCLGETNTVMKTKSANLHILMLNSKKKYTSNGPNLDLPHLGCF